MYESRNMTEITKQDRNRENKMEEIEKCKRDRVIRSKEKKQKNCEKEKGKRRELKEKS